MAIELKERDSRMEFPLEGIDIPVADSKIKHVILCPAVSSGTKVNVEHIQRIANDAKAIVDKHKGLQPEFMARVHDSLAAQGHIGTVYVKHYESARESHERQTKPIVILPFKDTPDTYVFPTAETQAEFDISTEVKAKLVKLEQDRRNINDISKNIGADTRLDPDLLNQVDNASSHIFQQRIQTLEAQISQLKRTFTDECKGSQIVSTYIDQLKMEAKHPDLIDNSTVSIVNSEWASLFTDNAEIKGVGLFTLLHKISSLDLPPLSTFNMHKLILATMCEAALEQTMEIDPSHPEVAKRKHRTVYVFLPAHINSPEVQWVLTSGFSEYFQNLQALNGVVNPPNPPRKTGIFSKISR